MSPLSADRLAEWDGRQPTLIARCPDHGLHGERRECFVCGAPVEKVPMVPAADLAEATAEVRRLLAMEAAVREAERRLTRALGSSRYSASDDSAMRFFVEDVRAALSPGAPEEGDRGE